MVGITHIHEALPPEIKWIWLIALAGGNLVIHLMMLRARRISAGPAPARVLRAPGPPLGHDCRIELQDVLELRASAHVPFFVEGELHEIDARFVQPTRLDLLGTTFRPFLLTKLLSNAIQTSGIFASRPMIAFIVR